MIFAESTQIFAALFILAAFNITGSPQTRREEIANPAVFQKIETSATVPLCRKSLKECGDLALQKLDLAGFGGSDDIKFKTETFVFKPKTAIYLFSMTGFEDDSVSGERLRLAFLSTGKGYRFVQIGRQFQCRRGVNAGKWTKSLCP